MPLIRCHDQELLGRRWGSDRVRVLLFHRPIGEAFVEPVHQPFIGQPWASIQLALPQGANDDIDLVRIHHVDGDSIEFEKSHRAQPCQPLVAVLKGLCLSDAVQQPCRFLDQGGKRLGSVKAGEGGSDSRCQYVGTSQLSRPDVPLVDRDAVVNGDLVRHWASRVSARSHRLVAAAQPLSTSSMPAT